MSEFLDMGGYAAFVWPAYGLTALVMLGLLITTRQTLRKRRAELDRLEAEMPRRRRSRGERQTGEEQTGDSAQ